MIPPNEIAEKEVRKIQVLKNDLFTCSPFSINPLIRLHQKAGNQPSKQLGRLEEIEFYRRRLLHKYL